MLQNRLRSVPHSLWPILLPAVLFFIPLLSPTPQHFQWATMGALWGLWVLSLNIVWGYVGQLSLAQVALGAVGAYVFVILSTQQGLPLLAAMLLGVGTAVLASLVLSAAALRLSGFYFTILTVTFALVIITVITNSETAGRTTGLVAPRSALPDIQLAGLQWLTGSPLGGFYALTAVVFVVLNACAVLLARSSAGAGMFAVRDDDRLAASVGLNPLHVKSLAFVLSGFVAGVAGILHGLSYQLVVPELFALDQALLTVLLIVLAGRGSLFAPAIAGAVYVIIYQAAPIEGNYRGGLLGAFVILIVLLVPGGIAGGSVKAAAALRGLRGRRPAGPPLATTRAGEQEP
jgi:ABC-type branched-subunit amino acid transport system permease subunit